ncbi:MAG: dihydrodipicolinate reductase [Rhodobacteraceae bacterium]|nr:dihydrodipicolinate reductase [Paracoccaceae bacterium]TVR46688.1 MAG: dihydrodipicolinate reductase [Paracoccaceae bacterium]
MRKLFALATSALLIAAPALADFQPVREESTFRSLVEGRELTRFGVRLEVLPQGQITGRGFGMSVGGQWEWRDGYFCRTLEFGSSGDPYNCQLVLRNGATLRFISDQGQGDQADLRLR